jgi:CHAD domain-containing protein
MREADVRRRWLMELAGEVGLEPAAARSLQRALDRDCVAARRAFREYAHSSACRERAERLAAAFADRRLVVPRADLEDFIARRLRRRWQRLLRALEVDGSDALAMHEARLRTKHARYATEALLPLLGGDPAPMVKPLRRLQACLGDHHDAFDALTWLGMRTRPPGPALLARLRGPIRRRMRERLGEFRETGRQLAVPKALRPER